MKSLSQSIDGGTIMKRLVKFVSLMLVFALIMALPVAATETSPYSSSYFMSRNTYLWETSSTSFQVWYNVTAVGTMSELGVNYIDIEKSSDGSNWSVVRTYTKDDYGSLVATNTANHSGYVSFNNKQSGYQYRAYVEFYAKNSSGGRGYSGTYAYF